MTAAILNQGETVIRDAVKTVLTNVGVATDQTAFSAAQTALDPANAGAGFLLIKAATQANVDFQTVDYTMTINGTSEFTGLQIWTIGLLNGAARTNAVSRTVRTVSIGVQTGDSFTIGVRAQHQDNS